MTDFGSGCPPSDLDLAVTVFQRHAFAALLAGEAPRITDVAEVASRDAGGIAKAIAWLQAHGRLERDGDLLVGAAGLTRRRTAHALTIGERRLHTWCAYDAIAIPVAVGVTARATTTCPICGQELVVDLTDGHLPVGPVPVLWMPRGPCEHVLDDFCVHANLFCGPEHLDSWRHAVGDPPGDVITLAEVAPLARRAWADIAARP
jgi:alkylmercury lyase